MLKDELTIHKDPLFYMDLVLPSSPIDDARYCQGPRYINDVQKAGRRSVSSHKLNGFLLNTQFSLEFGDVWY